MQAEQLGSLWFLPLRSLHWAALAGHTGSEVNAKSRWRSSAMWSTRAGQVVTQEELFQAVWAETVVSDDALTSCIQELRQALRDNARKPRYLETIHKRGVRFLGKVVSDQLSVVETRRGKSKGKKSNGKSLELPFPTPSTQHSAPTVVGSRRLTWHFLHERLEKAASGERQLIFVTGEAGIGKTTLIGAFLRGSRNWELGSGSSPPLILDPKSQTLKPVPWWLGWGSASSTTAQAKPICRSWKPWAGCVVSQTASSL